MPAERVGDAYVESLSAQTRARHGRHYTPAGLASELWDMTRGSLGFGRKATSLSGLVRDPACGAGALLLPALREHLRGSHGVDPRLVLAGLPALVEGWDLDPAAVWIANVVLAAELLPVLAAVPSARRRPLPALAHVGDGLAQDRPPATAVLMNPPYGRVRLGDDELARFADVLFGHPNLYGVFMAAGVEQTSASGVLSALVPTSWTAGRYFAPLRARLSREVRLDQVRFVEDRNGVFSGVLQETCLAVFTRKRVRKSKVTSTRAGEVTPIASVDTQTGSGVWLLPRRSELAGVAAGAAQMPATLASLGWRVSTGPLVWNRRKDDLTASPDSSSTAGRVVWAADIDGGTLHQDGRRDDKRFFRMHTDRDRRVMCLSEEAVLVQRTAAPESPRKLVAAVLDEDALARWGTAVVENHVNVVRPTSSSIPVGLMARVLATPTMDQVARCISGSVALSAFELESLPMPSEDTILEWADLDGAGLARAVARTYRPIAR